MTISIRSPRSSVSLFTIAFGALVAMVAAPAPRARAQDVQGTAATPSEGSGSEAGSALAASAPVVVPSGTQALPPGYIAIAPRVPAQAPILLVSGSYLQPMDTTRRALNAVYFELGGNAVIYSVNYERFVTQDVSARIGIGYLSVGDRLSSEGPSAALTSVPLMVNYLGVGRFNHRLELGAGLVVLHMSARATSGLGTSFGSGLLAAGTGTIAYRYAPLDGGFNFKAGFTPLVSSFGVYPMFGLGLGATF